MTFPFAYHARKGTPVTAVPRPHPVACWTRCADTGRMVRHWQTNGRQQADQPVCGHDAPPGAGDLLAALLRRHRDLRAA